MWFELLWRVVVTVSIVFVILRYIGNSSQQMGLLVDGVSLVDSGEWVLRISFGLRWVAVPFEVLFRWVIDDFLLRCSLDG